MLHRHLALHDEIEAVGSPIRDVQQLGKDVGGEPEWRIGHHPKRRGREPELSKIDFDDSGPDPFVATFDASAQLLGPLRVALDSPHLDASVEQRKGQRAGAGTEIDDQLAGSQVERAHKAVDDLSINKEVLAEFATSRVALGWLSPGHGPSP